MKLKLDEDIGARGREFLRAAGHDVSTVHEQGLGGATDADLARVCAGEQRALVSLDLDFANPVVYPPEQFAGIAVLRLPRGAQPRDLHALVTTLAGALKQKSLVGQLWVVEPGRVREYDRTRSGLT